MIEKKVIRALLKRLDVNSDSLTLGQKMYVSGVRGYFRATKNLSEKQYQILKEIEASLMIPQK